MYHSRCSPSWANNCRNSSSNTEQCGGRDSVLQSCAGRTATADSGHRAHAVKVLCGELTCLMDR
jgi:hypothetical protein